MRALGTDVQAGFEVLVVDQLGAARTLDPEALGDTARFFGRLGSDWLPGLLEPGHSAAINAIQNAKVKMQTHNPFAFCILQFALHQRLLTRHVVLRSPPHRVDLTDQIVKGVVASWQIQL